MLRTVVGVDLGSRSARALALDPEGKVRASATGAYPGAESWPEGRADQAGWLAGVVEAVTAVIEAVSARGARPEAICVGGQSPATVPVGGGLAVTPRHPAGVTGSPAEQQYAQRDLLRSESEHHRDRSAPLPGPGGGAGRGSPVLVREASQALDWLMARLGAGDRQSRWPGDPVLDGFGTLALTGTVVGETGGAFGLPRGVPLVAGAPDAYLAFWAGGIDTPGRGLDPGGRTGGLAVAIEASAAHGDLYALRGVATGVDIVGGPVGAHGLMLEWLAGLTGRPIPELLAMAEGVPPGSRGVMVLPYLEGERAPRWNRELRAEVVGLGTGHGPGHLCRSVLEGTAYGLRHIAESLPVSLDVLVCAGSPARSPLWCQIKADVLEVLVEVPSETGLAAYGAALAAGAGAGWWPAPGTASGGSWPRPAVTVVEPSPAQVHRDAYRRFIALGDAAELRLESEESLCPTR